MGCTDFGVPNIRQVPLHPITVLCTHRCPSYIKTQRRIFLYLLISSVFSKAILDIPLTNVYYRGLTTPVPNYIDTIPVFEMFVV